MNQNWNLSQTNQNWNPISLDESKLQFKFSNLLLALNPLFNKYNCYYVLLLSIRP